MDPQKPVPPPPPLSNYRPSFERAPLGSGPRRDKAPPPKPPRRSGLLLGVIYLFLFVVLVGGAGVAYLAFNPPSDLIRQKIAEQVRAQTGRDLVMAGPASFTFYPALGVSLHDVSLSGPPGMDGKLVQMAALEARVKVSSLLSRHVEIRSLVLRKPTFDFRVDKTGRNNWHFAARETPVRFAELQTPGTRRDAEPIVVAADTALPSAKLKAMGDLRLDDVRIEDGTFRFTDERTGKVEQVNDVNAKFGLSSLASPLVASGNLGWHDKRLDFDGTLTDVANINSKMPAHLAFNAKNDVISASYDGNVLIDNGVTLDGRVTAQSDSARALAGWFGTTLPPVSGFGRLSIQGTLKTAGNVTNFADAAFGLDGASAKGTIKVTTGGVRPFVEANLAISELDLNKYLTSAVTGVLATEGGAQGSGGAPDAGTNSGAAPKAGPSNGPGTAQPDQIEKLLNKPGSKVYGAVQRAGWSSEKLNVALLGVADGNARLNVDKIHFKNIMIDQSSVTVAVKDHAMQATFNDVQLYEGHGKGIVTVDGSAGSANIGANINLDGVSALPFLKDAANFEWVAGKANVGLQLTANGASQLQLVEGLNGKADFHFANGAIIGFNVPKAIRGISNGDFSGLRKSPSERTNFSVLGATFTIANGVAQNQDLQLDSPMLRVTGAGTIHMPERTVDYTVKPKVIAALEGQQDEKAASGIEIPVRITGSWDHPSYRPDLKGVLSDPGKTVETLKEIRQKFKGKKAGEIVDKLFGKKSDDDATGSTSENRQRAKDLLNKFLGKQEQ
ncbi:MAG TPA: AsmA family protein [Hyphomicrobium sp.]